MKEVLGKKGKKSVDPVKKEAKLEAIKEMRNMASDMMRGDIKSKMDKPKESVTVSADNKEDLKKGLNKAEEILDDAPDMEDLVDLDPADEDDDSDEMPTAEEIAEMEAELAELKKKLVMK